MRTLLSLAASGLASNGKKSRYKRAYFIVDLVFNSNSVTLPIGNLMLAGTKDISYPKVDYTRPKTLPKIISFFGEAVSFFYDLIQIIVHLAAENGDLEQLIVAEDWCVPSPSGFNVLGCFWLRK